MASLDVEVRMIYRILYNNGLEDEFIQPISVDNVDEIAEINRLIPEAFSNGGGGHITLSDGIKSILVNLSEVSRIKIESATEWEGEYYDRV